MIIIVFWGSMYIQFKTEHLQYIVTYHNFLTSLVLWTSLHTSFICPCFAVTIAQEEKFPTQLLFYLKASLLWIIVNDLASCRYAWWSILRLIFTAKQDFAGWFLNSKVAFGNFVKNSADYLENCSFINGYSPVAGN